MTAAAADHRASLRRPALSVAEYLQALRVNRLPAIAAALPADRL